MRLQAYATLLNCWKFLRASSYQVEMGNLCSMASAISQVSIAIIARYGENQVEDVTMDNQQPSPDPMFNAE